MENLSLVGLFYCFHFHVIFSFKCEFFLLIFFGAFLKFLCNFFFLKFLRHFFSNVNLKRQIKLLNILENLPPVKNILPRQWALLK